MAAMMCYAGKPVMTYRSTGAFDSESRENDRLCEGERRALRGNAETDGAEWQHVAG